MNKSKTEMTVVKSNVLIEGRYKFLLSEIKLILLMIAEIKTSDKDFKEYRIYVKDFIDSLESKRSDLYTESRKITKGLMEKVLEIETETGHLQTHFLSSVKHYTNEGYLDYKFDNELKPYLLHLKKSFTSYDIRNVLPCHSTYSIRVYQLLKAWENLKRRTIKVDELKYTLMIENEYDRFYDFKKRVLEVSKKELKKYSDIYFEYETIKKGRRIESIIFIIKKKRQRRFDFDGDKKVQHPYIEVKPVDMEQERLEKSFEIYKTDTVIDRFQKLSKKDKRKLEKSFLDSTQDNKFLTEKIKQEGLGDPSNDASIVSKMFNLFCQNKLLSDDERDIGKFQE